MTERYDAVPQSTSIRFLLTSSCNIRCHYCHNEFQGSVSNSAQSAWDMRTVSQLLAETGKDSPARVKFSGGEPLLRWHDLLSLATASRAAGAISMTLFSNLTLLSSDKAARLIETGIENFYVNLPSFHPDVYKHRVQQRRRAVKPILERGRSLRRSGAKVRLVMVLPRLTDPVDAGRFIATELAAADFFADCWDELSLMIDDWTPDPVRAQDFFSDVVRALPGVRQSSARPARSLEVIRHGKLLLVSRCSDWTSPQDRLLADTYVVPPGVALTEFRRGSAYRKLA